MGLWHPYLLIFSPLLTTNRLFPKYLPIRRFRFSSSFFSIFVVLLLYPSSLRCCTFFGSEPLPHSPVTKSSKTLLYGRKGGGGGGKNIKDFPFPSFFFLYPWRKNNFLVAANKDFSPFPPFPAFSSPFVVFSPDRSLHRRPSADSFSVANEIFATPQIPIEISYWKKCRLFFLFAPGWENVVFPRLCPVCYCSVLYLRYVHRQELQEEEGPFPFTFPPQSWTQPLPVLIVQSASVTFFSLAVAAAGTFLLFTSLLCFSSSSFISFQGQSQGGISSSDSPWCENLPK